LLLFLFLSLEANAVLSFELEVFHSIVLGHPKRKCAAIALVHSAFLFKMFWEI